MGTLDVNAIRKEYGTLVAVNDVTFSVEPGQVVGLIGPNGAGKTTLLRILATLLPPTSGSARVFGYDLAKEYLKIRKHIGYMPDFFNLYNDLTLAECLDFFARAYDTDHATIPRRIEQILDYVDLTDKRNAFIRHLSRGMVQRMGVAALLIHDPQLLLLDEPASGLDPRSRIQLRNVLRRLSAEGKTIIISSHILTELSGFCTHIAIMNKGGIELFGSVDDIERKVAGARKLKISVLGDCDKAVGLLIQHNNSNMVSVDGNTMSVEITKGPEEVAAINAYLVNNGVKVVSFYEEKTDLEDLFMKISGR
jgi:ABC-2 type transport system ATP-binding protein